MTGHPTIGPGTELDGFVIEAVAGHGGMGVVYRARQRQPDRTVALKVIAAALADDPAFVARFRREAAIAAQIEHPNVIPVYAVGDAGGVFYLAMRYVDGVDLRTMLVQQQMLQPSRAAAIVDQVAQALDAAHAHGLVHRDVKPANILISTAAGREHVYLSDFGLSRHVHGSSGLTGTGAFLGTVDYVAPEQARGEQVDARTDVYALGCVLFQAITGSVPYPLENELAKLYAHDSQPPPSVLARAPDVPAGFDAVCARAMAKAPDDRYQSAGDLGRAALAAAAGGERETVIPTLASERPLATGRAKPALVRPTVIGAAIAAVIAIVVVVLVLASSGGSPNASAARSSAGTTSVVQSQRVSARHGYIYRAVLSPLRTPPGTAPGKREPYFLGLWVRRDHGPLRHVERLKLPWRFTASSQVRQFELTPNSDGSANVALSWFVQNGQPNAVTHYLTLVPTGINVDS